MIHIALLGLGVVGKGTLDLLEQNRDLLASRLGDTIEVKYILDLRDFPGTPYAGKVVHDFDIILRDPEVTLVAEMMGGAHPAYDYTKAALAAGKSVITSNKEVVATYGEVLLQIARANRVAYAFEASVGGGIPIVRPLANDFLSNEVTGISGILNGTTNYILTEMTAKGRSFADALAEAQAKGYAEKDPTADVDGIDTCRKICILTGIATGVLPDAKTVRTEGIRGIEKDDVALLAKSGRAVKLLGRMQRVEDKPCPIVAPFVCPDASPLAHVNDVFNGIMVSGAALGDTMFYGRGAGAAPTASAVVTDMVATLRDGADSFAPVFTAGTAANCAPSGAFICRRYVRSSLSEATLTAKLGTLTALDGGAYITARAYTEAEFDALTPTLGLISTLRVL